MRTFVLAFTSCLAAAGAVLHQAAFSFPQPAPLASWTNTSAGPTPCTTQAAYAIRSFATGWPGQCTDLLPYAPITLPVVPMTIAECRKGCVADVRCSVWQFIDTAGVGACFMGVGDHCMDRNGETRVNVTGAERIQRGSVKVLSNLTNFNGNSESLWVVGLKQFGVATSGDVINNTLRCRDYCYSNIDCTYWQFGTQCFAETKENKAQFPLTLTEDITQGTPGAISSNTTGEHPAHSMEGGEYIQHTCVTAAALAATAAAATAAAAEKAKAAAGSGYVWLYVLLGVLALGALAALAYCCMNGGKTPKKRAVKKTRAVKAVPKVEAAVPESVPLMPLMVPSPYAQFQQPMYAPMSQFQQQY